MVLNVTNIGVGVGVSQNVTKHDNGEGLQKGNTITLHNLLTVFFFF